MARGFLPCLAALLTAVVLRQARGTVPEPNVEWTLLENVQCGLATIVEQGSDEAAQFETEAAAKAACAELGESNCYGIYDMSCAGATYFLCSADIITSSDDLDFSSTSCVQELSITTFTATTTTNLATTQNVPVIVTNAATTAMPAVSTTATPGAAVDPCDVTCSILDGSEVLTCREQILGFVLPTTDTASMPLTDLTCEQKQGMVAGEGTCQECANCDVCLTTLADTRLWKISDGGKVDVAARAVKGARWGFAPIAAGVALIAGIAVGSAVALRRVGLDLSRWELLRQQLSME